MSKRAKLYEQRKVKVAKPAPIVKPPPKKVAVPPKVPALKKALPSPRGELVVKPRPKIVPKAPPPRVAPPPPKLPPAGVRPPKLTAGGAAKQYEVTGTVKGGVIINLEESVRRLLTERLRKQGLKLSSIKFSDYKKLGLLEHQISFKAVVVGSPIAPAVVSAVILAFNVALIAIGIIVVGEFIIKPIFVGAPPPTPPAPPPAGAPPEVWEKYYGAYEKIPEAPAPPIVETLKGLLPVALILGAGYLLITKKPWEKKPPKK